MAEEINEQDELEKTVSSIGWNVVVERFNQIVERETNLSSLDLEKDAYELKADAKAMIKAREIVGKMIIDVVTKANYIKKKRVNYG